MTDAAGSLTSAQRWARDVRRQINERTMTGYEQFLDEGFVQESRRSLGFSYNREQALGSIDTLRQMGLHVDGEDVATAGQLHLLTRRRYEHRQAVTVLLAVTAWTAEGRLHRMVEFDAAALPAALAELESLAATSPVLLIDP